MLLKFLRKKKNMKRIMWVLAILIIPAFVIWGAGTSDKKKREGPDHAGKIFNRKVSFEEYVDMWQVTRDEAMQSFGTNIPAEVIDQLTWNRIILLEAAKRENIPLRDAEVVERIVSLPVFQRDGRFDKKLYKSLLGDAVKGFEERIRDDILIYKLQEKVTSGVSVTEEEVKAEYKKGVEKIKASYVSIPFIDFKKDARYTELDLAEFFEKNKEAFRMPEQINVKYIGILFSAFEREVYITEETITRYFEEHIGDFKKLDSEEMPILNEPIKNEISEKLAAERKKSLAEELAYRVLDEVRDGNDLDKAAGSFALETKKTGFFSRQDEIPGIGWSYDFTKKGFELTPGEISDVLIRTDKGFYIIQLNEKKESYIPDFKDAKDAVIRAYIKDRAIELSEKKAKKVQAAINHRIKQGMAFKDAAQQFKMGVSETDFIRRDGYIPALGPAGEFVDVCVSLKDKETTGLVQMPESWVIVQLDEYADIEEVKFVEEKKGFKENLLLSKRREEFNRWFEEFKKTADFVSYTSGRPND